MYGYGHGMVCSKCLRTGLHGCEVLLSLNVHFVHSELRWHVQYGLGSFPMTNTPALLSLPDVLGASDPAFFAIWSRFRQLRRFLSTSPSHTAGRFAGPTVPDIGVAAEQ